MERIRTIKNRLSLSADKLSATDTPQSPPRQRKSLHLGVASPSSEGNIASSVSVDSDSVVTRRKHRKIHQRRSSFADSQSSEEVDPKSSAASEGSKSTVGSLNQSFDGFHGFKAALNRNTTQSLMDEVMKEVDKISKVNSTMNGGKEDNKNVETISKVNNSMNGRGEVNTVSSKSNLDQIILSSHAARNINISSKIESTSTTQNDNVVTSMSSFSVKSEELISRREQHPLDGKSMTQSMTSTKYTESLTSGYFSDSTSDDISGSDKKPRHDRAKTMSPIPRFFRSSRHDKAEINAKKSVPLQDISDRKESTKKESIYSRFVKSTKRDTSTSRLSKEPLYARIRPKIKTESNFQPIDPSLSKESSKTAEIIKPEPIYSKFRSKIISRPISKTSAENQITSSGSDASSFEPVVISSSAHQQPSTEPIYSVIKAKRDKCNS